MTTPQKVKKIYKNIDWKNKEEKEAFYNHYFRKSKFVRDQIDKEVNPLKEEIKKFEAEQEKKK